MIERAAEGKAVRMVGTHVDITEFNPAAERILGLPCAEAIGQPAWSLMERLAV